MTTTAKKKTTKTVKAKTVATAIPNLPKIPFAFEVLDATSKQRTKARKIEVLQKYAHDSIMALLIWNFDETAISVLPPGEVPYGNNKEDIWLLAHYQTKSMTQLIRCLKWVLIH